METHFARAARKKEFTEEQLELIVGSLLGDATLQQTTSGYCFRVHHGVDQRAFVDWKYQRLREFVRTAPRISGRGIYFRTVTHPLFTVFRDEFYPLGKKIVPRALLRKHLTPLALAVWVMDDGAIDGRSIRVNTQSFTVDDVDAVTGLLSDTFGLSVSINFDKGMPRLRFSTDSAARLASLIRPHVISEMMYKLP